MTDYASLRRNMVDSQVAPNEVTDRRVLRAMGEVPREMFVSEAQKPVAYIDQDLKHGGGRVLLSPMTVARLVQLAGIEAGHSVLDIGCGSGYVSAVAARLAGRVIGLESDPGLALRARQSLATLGLGNTKVVEGPLEAGYPGEGPYDAVILSGSVPEVPDRLTRQVKEGGRLVAIIGETASGRLTVFTRIGNALGAQARYDAPLAPLPGFERAPAFVF